MLGSVAGSRANCSADKTTDDENACYCCDELLKVDVFDQLV